MRFIAYFKKTAIENLREWRILAFVLAFGPFFIFMMAGYYGAADPAFGLIVVNRDVDSRTGAATAHSENLIASWREALRSDGKPYFDLTEASDTAAARDSVRFHEADLLVEIPAGFAAGLDGNPVEATAALINHTDDSNLQSAMAMAVSDYLAVTYAFAAAGIEPPLDIAIEPLGTGRVLSEFELLVPALLVLSVIMILFTAATSLIMETDRHTMIRLRLSHLRPAEFLGAIAANQLLLGLTALVLSYAAALICGYRSDGSLPVLLLVGGLTILSVVAIAVLVAAVLKSMFELLTVGVFPFFILMFFSECMFPMPRIELLNVLGHWYYANDVLPTTLGVRAFSKILTGGAGIADLSFEIGGILVLTTLYFALGAVFFHRRHLKA